VVVSRNGIETRQVERSFGRWARSVGSLPDVIGPRL
jgi:hypothetical protein